MQHSFISLIPDSESIARLKEQTKLISSESGLANKNLNQFFHLTLLDVVSENLSPKIFEEIIATLNINLPQEFEVEFELIKHHKNKYLYCAIPSESFALKDLRTSLKLALQKADVTLTVNNSGHFLPHITLINNINPYQKFLITKQVEQSQKRILIKFKEFSLYNNGKS